MGRPKIWVLLASFSGEDAFLAGLALSDNPHPPGDKHDGWREGWCKQFHARRLKLRPIYDETVSDAVLRAHYPRG